MPLRVLVRVEGGSEVVYPIGRRTSIGRTIDNDIQIDASNISRHHAVLLAGSPIIAWSRISTAPTACRERTARRPAGAARRR